MSGKHPKDGERHSVKTNEKKRQGEEVPIGDGMRGTRFAIPSAVKSQQKPTSNTPPETRLKRGRVEFIFLPLRRAPR